MRPRIAEVVNDIHKVYSVQETSAIDYIPPEVHIAKNLPNLPTKQINVKDFLLSKLSLADAAISEESKEKLMRVIINNSNAFVGPDGNIGHLKEIYNIK